MQSPTRRYRVALSVALATSLSLGLAHAFPSKSPHPNDRDSIRWEQDGTRDGTAPHNHHAARSFGSWNSFHREPYTSSGCWDDRTFRVDRVGTFDQGHCFIDEAEGSDNIPRYAFVGAWPVAAKARVRDAFAAWSAIASDDPELLTGIEFQEVTNTAQADIKVFWENQGGASGGGFWVWNRRELHFDNSLSWYFGVDPRENQPDGIQKGQWHFLSVALHEIGHAVGLEHQLDGDLMEPTVGQPPEVPGHRYFVAPDTDSITGVRDLYSQPHRRVAFVIDDTGSMSQEIGLVKATVADRVDDFVAESLLLRYHLLTYKDTVDYRGSTTDPERIKFWVDGLVANGGGDCPEEMLGALNRIAIESPHSDAWVMTDAGFHGGLGDLATTLFNLVQARVRVHPIVYSVCFAEGTTADGQPLGPGPGPGTGPGLGRPLQEGDGLGVEAFIQLAEETGGHYFPIATEETQAAASILLNEMVTTADLMRRRETVTVREPRSFEVWVDGASDEANFLLNSSGSGIGLTLEDPSGVVVADRDPGVEVITLGSATYVRVTNPLAGLWRATVSGIGDFTLSASGRSSVGFENLGDTSLPLGEPVTVRVALTGAVEGPVFRLVEPDGTPVATLELFDDGFHGDGSAGDTVYAGSFVPRFAGRFLLQVEGVEGTTHTPFERTSPESLRVQPLQVAGDGNRLVNRGETLVRQFQIQNLGDATDTFQLTVTSDRGWADVTLVPARVILGAGATTTLDIPVRVPADAEPSSVDEIVLVAISEADPFVNDAASAFTTMRTLLVAAEP